jgi:hypothetical protein
MLHPAEHRALRELHAFTHQLARHWSHLGERLGGAEGELLLAGAGEAEEVLGELEAAAARRGLGGRPAAEALGSLVSARPPAPDVTLERSQALRWALHDADHVTVGLRYVARLAATRGDDVLRALLDGWAERLEARERDVRAAAVALGDRPDEAVLPADPSPAGRAGHRFAAAIGAAGEWVDQHALRRRRE